MCVPPAPQASPAAVAAACPRCRRRSVRPVRAPRAGRCRGSRPPARAARPARPARARPRASSSCRRRAGSARSAPARRPSRRAARRDGRSTCPAAPAARRCSPPRRLEAHVHARATGKPSARDQLLRARRRRARPRSTARRRPGCCPPRARAPCRGCSRRRRPSARAISAITPGRLGTETRSSRRARVAGARAEQPSRLLTRRVDPGGDRGGVAHRELLARLGHPPRELVDRRDQRVAIGHVDVGPDRAVGAGDAGGVAEARPDRRQTPGRRPRPACSQPARRAGWRARAAGARPTPATGRASPRRSPPGERRSRSADGAGARRRRPPCCPSPASGTTRRRRRDPRARAPRPPSRRPPADARRSKRSSLPASASTRLVEPTSVTTQSAGAL